MGRYGLEVSSTGGSRAHTGAAALFSLNLKGCDWLLQEPNLFLPHSSCHALENYIIQKKFHVATHSTLCINGCIE
jgi:hypothetical protein